jgi:hypothetical protein
LRRQQASDIGTRHEEQKRDRGKQKPERVPRAPRERFFERLDPDGPSGIRRRKNASQLASQGIGSGISGATWRLGLNLWDGILDDDVLCVERIKRVHSVQCLCVRDALQGPPES